MLNLSFHQALKQELSSMQDAGLYKEERLITSSQSAEISLSDGRRVINFCANNYLGLSNHPVVIEAAQSALKQYGYGMSSVRFICGTLDLHKTLEKALSDFLGKEDTILYAAAFDANGGLFEPFFTAEDAIFSDALNHASLIDGIRLSKAKRYRYQNNDMQDLKAQLQAASKEKPRRKVIVTDGVFSMDGTFADLKGITALAKEYEALVVVDDCHATGFIGALGKGTPEYHHVMDDVDVITGTLGKALGGGSGGFISGPREIIDLLRQRSRPYLFSNALPPPVVAGALGALDYIQKHADLRERLHANTRMLRQALHKVGVVICDGEHPIIPVMVGDSSLSQRVSQELLNHHIYAVGFFYPVVPRDTARIRLQVSALHTADHLQKVAKTFAALLEQFPTIPRRL